ncbi:hypothetical protein [Deminuibacter soli]|uniref:Uncharacterized protein n=1 Tax=Deminuibacter soli TaxID=2291815 RepID=A0A3E1NER8_9BACT|nr:hypothetical protein [Deminuibacter soli]RFM26294.1 hypothetical protein DXN05_20510 [Deminuibacter soli]
MHIYEYQQTRFSKAVLTGLFCGIAATLTCLLYGFIYRFNTGFTLSAIINVPSIIIGCHILLVIAGLVYYALQQALGRAGNAVYMLLFAALTLFCIWQSTGVVRSPIHELTIEFRQLLIGMIIIIGSSASFLMPYLFGNKAFERNVL